MKVYGKITFISDTKSTIEMSLPKNKAIEISPDDFEKVWDWVHAPKEASAGSERGCE